MSNKKEVVSVKENSKINDKNNSNLSKDVSKEERISNESSKEDGLLVLKNLENDSKKAFKPIRKVRIDLVIFGILIYILGIFTGLFVGVGISQGDLSLNSFQKFFSSEDQIQVEDIPKDDTGVNANQGIVINNAKKTNSGGVVTGGGSSEGSGGAGSAGGPSVSYMGDTPSSGGKDNEGYSVGEDSENYPVVDTTPKQD